MTSPSSSSSSSPLSSSTSSPPTSSAVCLHRRRSPTSKMLLLLPLMTVYVALLGVLSPPQVLAQSNYASHANNIGYQGEGLPEEATLDGKVTKLDDLSPIIFLNRTKAALNCAAGSMQVEMKFNEPFFGIAYADFDRNSACQIVGRGELAYKLELPLKGCGTKQEPQRVFTNNIVVRFHPGLEMDGDEIVTIVCRYPPPLAPPPAGLPAPILNPIVPASLEPPLRGIQMLFIICGIVFMTLLLLGLGVSYHCLRRRTIPVVRRLPMSMGSGSEITRLSGSSLGNISHFEGLKIPRAHAPLATVHSLSGSDGPVVSDTLPSDYPSESHSEAEDLDTRSLPVSSAGSFENRAFVQETSSIYSEHYGHTQEFQAGNALAAAAMQARHPIAVREPSPKFDVQVRVKRAPPPPPQQSLSSSSATSTSSGTASETESLATVQRDRNNLSTIMESHEDRESVATIDTHTDVAHSHFTYVPELHQAPRNSPPISTQPQLYTQQTLMRQQEEHHVQRTATNNRWPPEDYADGPAISLGGGTEPGTDNYSVAEMTDYPHRYADETTTRLHQQHHNTTTNSTVQIAEHEHTSDMERTVERLAEPPIVVRRPEVTSHVVDDVFLRTITEKRTIEDVERYKQLVTEYKARPRAPAPPVPAPVPDPTWDVTIRNYPTDNVGGPGAPWENFSDISSVVSEVATPRMERSRLVSVPPPQYINAGGKKLTSPELVGNMKPIEMPPEDKAVPNWDVLIRVLEHPDDEQLDSEEELATIGVANASQVSPDDVSSVHSASPPTVHGLQRQLSYDDRVKWKEIITTESSLRSMLTEAVVREDFERIRSDSRYERIFEPHTWDVLIRILAPPSDDDVELRHGPNGSNGSDNGGNGGAAGRSANKKKEAWDTRSRRSSLPTLYEYDSDGGSSVRTIGGVNAAEAPVSQRGSVTFMPQLPGTLGNGTGGGGGGAGGPGGAGSLSGGAASIGAPSRRTSRSSYRSDNVDMRSMTEVMVDFARPEHLDNGSDASSVYPNRYYDDDPYDRRSMHRTLSQPSLARSASEFTERWGVPQPDDDGENTSPEVTPRPVRSVRVMSVQPPPPAMLRSTVVSAAAAPSASAHSSSPSSAQQYAEQNASSSYQQTTNTDENGTVVTRRDWYAFAKKK